jgi:hypothetical protein
MPFVPAASHQCLPGQLSHKGGIHPLHGHWASQRHIYNTDIPATLWMCLRDVTADVAREVAPNVTSDITLDVAPMVGAKDFSPNRCIDRESYSVKTIGHGRRQIQSWHGEKLEGVTSHWASQRNEDHSVIFAEHTHRHSRKKGGNPVLTQIAP